MKLVDYFAVEPFREASRIEEASPFTSWFKKKPIQPPDDQGDFGFETSGPRKDNPKAEYRKQGRSRRASKSSAWDRLKKAFSDPDLDPENTIYVPPRPEYRYYTRQHTPQQMPQDLPARLPAAPASAGDSNDPYEKDRAAKEHWNQIRYAVIKELDKVNKIKPQPGKPLGFGMTMVQSKKDPRYWRAYYPGMQIGHIVIFNPSTGWMGTQLKKADWFEQVRAARAQGKGPSTTIGKASPVLSQGAKDRQAELDGNARRAVKKFNPDAKGEIKTKKTDAGTEYYVDDGEGKVVLSKDNRLYGPLPKEPKKAEPKQEPKNAPSAGLAKDLGDMDPALQKAILKRKQSSTQMSDKDIHDSLARENSISGDEKWEVGRRETDKGTYIFPSKDGQLLPGTRKVLFVRKDGKADWVSRVGGGEEAKPNPYQITDEEMEKARKLVNADGTVSISKIQSLLRVGYNKAATIAKRLYEEDDDVEDIDDSSDDDGI